MVYKSNFENKVKHGLIQKAEEVESSNKVFSHILNRIEDYEGGNSYMLKDRVSSFITKKVITVTLCGVLAFGGIAYLFSEEVRAATLDAINQIKTVFILDKSEGDYSIIELTEKEKVFTPIIAQTSWLSDEELTKKMGFNVYFPETLYRNFKYEGKAESVGIRMEISAETMTRLEINMLSAISDEEAFNSIKEYKPYRYVFATYISEDGDTIFINMKASEDNSEFKYTSFEKGSKIIKDTKVGKARAAWLETVSLDYPKITRNGMGTSDIYEKPKNIVKNYSLTWVLGGVEYYLSTYQDFELNMKDAVKIAESFMAQQE